MCVCACVHTHVLKMEAWMRVDGWMLESSRQWEQAMQKLRGQRKYGDSVADKRPLWKAFGAWRGEEAGALCTVHAEHCTAPGCQPCRPGCERCPLERARRRLQAGKNQCEGFQLCSWSNGEPWKGFSS